MSKLIKGLVVGLGVCIGLSLFEIPSTAHANYGTKLTYGYKVPKALHGKWYFGNQKAVFTGTYKNYKGLDVSGQGPDVIYTRKNFHNTLSLNKHGNYHKVKLVHFGF